MSTSSTMTYWCLGSNINPEQHIRLAVRQFQQDYPDVLVSNCYRCPAVGFDGADFLNVALEVKTSQKVDELIAYADRLEQQAGRVRASRGRFDSRTLDVDLLMYGALTGMYHDRQWPNSDIDDFSHVLCPLAEIAPEVCHPVSGKTFASLWAASKQGAAALTRIDDVW